MTRLRTAALSAVLVLQLALTGCATTSGGAIAPEARSAAAQTESATPPSLGTPVERANAAKTQADIACDAVTFAVPAQTAEVRKNAGNRAQGGLLVTTLVGALGSVVTAFLAANQDVNSAGNVDKGPATIGAAATAGATAIAGVVSYFVAGQGVESRIESLNTNAKQVAAALTQYKQDCSSVTDATASVCIQAARRLDSACRIIALGMPYKPRLPSKTVDELLNSTGRQQGNTQQQQQQNGQTQQQIQQGT